MTSENIRIMIIEDLFIAAESKRAVTIPGTVWEKPKPAMVILHLPAMTVLKLLKKGIYLYSSKRKEKSWKRKKNN